MNTVSIYIFTALVIFTKFAHTKEIYDLVIQTSGVGIPEANDKHYNLYEKDYFGLINGYSVKTEAIKSYLEKEYIRWAEQLKSNTKSLEFLNSVHTQVIAELTAYQNDVQKNYQNISLISIGDIVKAVNHMRENEKSFYAKVKLNSQKCHDFVDQNLYYKWEKPALYCIHKKITRTLALQLQYTYGINVYYARLVDQFNLFAKISQGEKEKFISINLKKANVELMENRTSQIKSIQKLLKDIQACAATSYGTFDKLKESFTEYASECF